LHLFDLPRSYEEAEDVPTIATGAKSSITAIGSTPDGTKILLVDDDAHVTCFNMATFEQLWQVVLHRRGCALIPPLEYSADSSAVIIMTSEVIWVLNTADGSVASRFIPQRYSLENKKWLPKNRSPNAGIVARFSRCCKYIAINTGIDINAKENTSADAVEHGSVHIFPYPAPVEYNGNLNDWDNANFNDNVVLAIPHGTHLDVPLDKQTHTNGHGDLTWGYESDVLAHFCSDQVVQVVRIDLEAKSFEVVSMLHMGLHHFAMYLSFIPGSDDKELMTGTGHVILFQVWNPFNGKMYQSSNIAANEKRLQLVESGQADSGPCEGDDVVNVHRTTGPHSVFCMCHANGRHVLMSGGKDDTVHIYDPVTRRDVKGWAHSNSIRTATWSGDYSRVCVALNGATAVLHCCSNLSSS
jgi:hypothetical protein